MIAGGGSGSIDPEPAAAPTNHRAYQTIELSALALRALVSRIYIAWAAP